MSSDEQSQRSLGVDRNIIVTNPSMDSATEDALPKDGDEKSATPPPGLLTTTSNFLKNATSFSIMPSKYYRSSIFARFGTSLFGNEIIIKY